jgi:choline dehydrogenase-like flavoprotein
MFVDSRQVEDNACLHAEVCIIGGGMAGLAIALELDRQGISTLVLESGGYEPDEKTRDLYRGDSIGIPYLYADGCRSRYLGGSSNCWGGWCRPMQTHDFETRSWVQNSGWPITYEDLRPYYTRTHTFLKLGPENYDTEYWTSAMGWDYTHRFPLSGEYLTDAISQFSAPLRAGRDYHQELSKSQFITVCLYANVVAIETNPEGVSVVGLQVKTLTGRQFRAMGKNYVLGAGGIENARLLLASNRVSSAGIGNAHDLVGRYFMDHPRVTSGKVIFNDTWKRNKLYDQKFHYQNEKFSAFGTKVAAQLFPTPKFQQENGLLNSQVWFASKLPGNNTSASEALIRFKHRLEKKEKQGYTIAGDLLKLALSPLDSLEFVASRLFQPNWLIKEIKMQAIVEPVPDPSSRVILTQEKDALGMPRVSVEWKLDEQVKRTFDQTFKLVANELERIGVATVILDPQIEGQPWPSSFEYEGTWHHMGTTRMHSSPKLGVVDSDCRVYGMNNLYIAGSSVFPTSGANFPTITLIALALRLADHLCNEIARN